MNKDKKKQSKKRQKSQSPATKKRHKRQKYQKQVKGPSIEWWKISSSLPQFLDAESSITAAKFGARRLPEMKSLWRAFMHHNYSSLDQIKDGGNDLGISGVLNRCVGVSTDISVEGGIDTSYHESGGCKVSKRHLRRRTGSHNSKKKHRYPNGLEKSTAETLPQTKGKKIEPETTMTSSGSSDNDNDNDNYAKKRPNQIMNESISRKARRKPSIMIKQHDHWKRPITKSENEHEDNIQMNKQNSNWLETHLWHTKRFIMSPPLSIYNNWCIPLGHINRGSRAALRLNQTKATVQDATWMNGGRVWVIESSTQEDLVHALEILCGGMKHQSAPFLENKKVLLGLKVGFGYIYDINATFPLGMIGPATFLFGQKENKTCFCKIMIDSTIQEDFRRMTQQVVEKLNTYIGSSPLFFRHEALTLLKVRGLNATNAIVQSLANSCGSNNDKAEEICSLPNLEWDILSQNTNIHALIERGTIVTTNASPQKMYAKECKMNNTQDGSQDDKFVKDYINDVQTKVLKNSITSSKAHSSKIILVSQCPNKCLIESRGNMSLAACGWDIWCDPTVTKDFFLALNYYGEACAIGLIEASTLAIESNPPLSSWPRDFPDTQLGMDYWSSDSNEWKLIRYCIEEGIHGGRIHTVMSSLINKCNNPTMGDKHSKTVDTMAHRWKHEQISWHSLDSNSANDDHKPVIVIRGSFIEPFVQALSRWCPEELLHLKPKVGKSRLRRKVSDHNKPITIPPLQRQKSEEQKSICLTLLRSLSMFALLRCHIIVSGSGRLTTGMAISFRKEKEQGCCLGFAVSGMFSQSRGCYHGLGYVCSKRFLSRLSVGEHGDFILQRKTQGPLVVALKVHIHYQGSDDFSIAYLTLLP